MILAYQDGLRKGITAATEADEFNLANVKNAADFETMIQVIVDGLKQSTLFKTATPTVVDAIVSQLQGVADYLKRST